MHLCALCFKYWTKWRCEWNGIVCNVWINKQWTLERTDLLIFCINFSIIAQHTLDVMFMTKSALLNGSLEWTVRTGSDFWKETNLFLSVLNAFEQKYSKRHTKKQHTNWTIISEWCLCIKIIWQDGLAKNDWPLQISFKIAWIKGFSNKFAFIVSKIRCGRWEKMRFCLGFFFKDIFKLCFEPFSILKLFIFTVYHKANPD